MSKSWDSINLTNPLLFSIQKFVSPIYSVPWVFVLLSPGENLDCASAQLMNESYISVNSYELSTLIYTVIKRLVFSCT